MTNIRTSIVRSRIVVCCAFIIGGLLFIGANSISGSYHTKMLLIKQQRKQWVNTVISSVSNKSRQSIGWEQFAKENPKLMLKATTAYYLQK